MYLEPISKEQLQDIYAFFNTSEEFLRNATECLKEWLKTQPHLPDITDDEFLINVVLRNKNSVEKSKAFLDQYYTYRATKEIYSKRDILSDRILQTLRVFSVILLPKLTPDGYRVWIWRFPVGKHFHPSAENLFELATIVLDICLKADTIKSSVLIVDYKNMPSSLATLMLLVGKKLSDFSTKIIRNPCQKVIVLNLPRALIPAYNLAKTFVKKKLADRAQIWTKEPKDLPEILPKSILPAEYGGEMESLDKLADMTLEYFKEFREWILQQREVKADLSKKRGYCVKNKNHAVLGINGSFKKIEVD